MERDFDNDPEKFELRQLASRKVVKLRSFYIHAFFYSIGLILFTLKNYFGLPLNVFPVRYLNNLVMIVWTTAFLVSAVEMFASFKIFGEEWEQRKLKSILEKEDKKQKRE
ncbi:2TM domain-containing protein [Flavobacterium sp. JAS]|uniref:2TM domain-containing protein n=1 Tax=Flavobacterium sp. JAS TaxID=2897329 RepID=UPI000DA01889|nr:2TM domain-containing protein [Flavobacterium sp. JAS]MCD0471359.1 2TM domain-containing protein [Flavobacterium sp. JAS]